MTSRRLRRALRDVGLAAPWGVALALSVVALWWSFVQPGRVWPVEWPPFWPWR